MFRFVVFKFCGGSYLYFTSKLHMVCANSSIRHYALGVEKLSLKKVAYAYYKLLCKPSLLPQVMFTCCLTHSVEMPSLQWQENAGNDLANISDVYIEKERGDGVASLAG